MSTILHYTLQDAGQWAEFSGDFNPVHFDLHFAQRAGLKQRSVHGMRAMLDVKRHLTGALLVEQPQADFYAFSTRLRRPLLYQTPYRLQLAPGRHHARLQDAVTLDDCLTSKLAPAQPLALKTGEEQQKISSEELIALSQRFPGEASDIRQCWSFLDALLFRQLLQSSASLKALSQVLPSLAGMTLTEVFSQLPVMQTHHETHFSACLLHAPLPQQPLFWAIQPTSLMGNQETGLVLQAVIQAWIQRPLMTTAVTLKTWPTRNS